MNREAVSRRLILLMLGATMAAVTLVLIATVPEKADAASRFKTVTRTFSSTQQITIPAAGQAAPYPSEISARGFRKGKIRDVNLTLKNFSHTFPDDVDVMVSHRGVNRIVMSDTGGSTDANNITLKLDDEATALLPDSGPPTGGTFQPTNIGAGDTFPAPAPTPSGPTPLSGFDGKNPNGTWSLWVNDDAGGDSGQFAGGWSIRIKAKVRR